MNNLLNTAASKKKEWYQKPWGVVIAILILPFFAIWYAWAKSNWSKNVKIGVTVASLLFVVIALATSPDSTTQTSTTTQQPNPTTQQETPKTEAPAPQPVSPYKKINDNVAGISDKLSPQLFKTESELATENTEPPYEVIVNSKTLNAQAAFSCSDAKNVAYEVMKKLYTDNDTKDKITRVLINVPYRFRVSLGSTDGLELTKANNWAGKTNFFNVYNDFQGENEDGAMQDRTWIVYIGDCQ